MEKYEFHQFTPEDSPCGGAVVVRIGNNMAMELMISAQDESDLRDLLTPQLSDENIYQQFLLDVAKSLDNQKHLNKYRKRKFTELDEGLHIVNEITTSHFLQLIINHGMELNRDVIRNILIYLGFIKNISDKYELVTDIPENVQNMKWFSFSSILICAHLECKPIYIGTNKRIEKLIYRKEVYIQLAQIALSSIENIEKYWYDRYPSIKQMKSQNAVTPYIISAQKHYHYNKKYINDDIDLSNLAPLLGMTTICLTQVLFLLTLKLHLNIDREKVDSTNINTYILSIVNQIRLILPNVMFEIINKPIHKCQIKCRDLDFPTFDASVF